MTSDANLWRATCYAQVTAAPLAQDLTVDLAIIGGGFTGLSAALKAARAGASVCLLEAHQIGHGGSGRNVGLVNAGLWLPPETILAQMGAQAGQRLIDALAVAPARVFDLIAREGIDCEATRNGTLHLAHSTRGLCDLQDRYRQGQGQGTPIELLDRKETARRTGSDMFHGALFDPRAGTIQPLAYAMGLARAAMGAGAQVFEHSLVTRLTPNGGAWRLDVCGQRVQAGHVLMATNAYSMGQMPVTPRFVPVHYCQFATDPLPEALAGDILAGGEGAWDTGLIMSSLRRDKAGRLVFGAIGNGEGAGRALHAAWARRKLAVLFPKLKSVEFRHGWSGRIAMTRDHIPKILRLGGTGLAVFGYSGRGIGPGTVFGAAAAQALLSGQEAQLPVAPIAQHDEVFAALKAFGFELGASVVHGLDAWRLP